MGKQRRKFEAGFKQQIVSEVESGMLSVNAASRKYQLSGSVIDRGGNKPVRVVLRPRRRFVRRPWSARTENSRKNWLSCTWKTPS